MAERSKPARIVPFPTKPGVVEALVRELAQDSSNVILSKHARVRMIERAIWDVDVFRILRSGHVIDPPTRTDRGETQCKMVKEIRGSRDAGVITIILQSGKLFVKTVEWEDK